jgi:xylan 1,4-beta-xylosidase
VTVQQLDNDHGNVLPKYAAMGRPVDPTPAQVDQLNRETALPGPQDVKLEGRTLQLSLTPNSLVLVKVEP